MQRSLLHSRRHGPSSRSPLSVAGVQPSSLVCSLSRGFPPARFGVARWLSHLSRGVGRSYVPILAPAAHRSSTTTRSRSYLARFRSCMASFRSTSMRSCPASSRRRLPFLAGADGRRSVGRGSDRASFSCVIPRRHRAAIGFVKDASVRQQSEQASKVSNSA